MTFEEEILKVIKKQKLSPKEAQLVLKNLKKPHSKYYEKHIDFPDKHTKFLVIADPHMGHKEYKHDLKQKAAADARRQNCDFGLNIGDTVEGMSGIEGHVYELDYIGYTAQVDFFAKEFHFGMPMYSIEAQDSHSGWYHNKGNAGVEIGKELDKKAKDYKFIGYDEQDLILDNGLKIRLRHPGGGTAYAISYKLQKYINSISGGNKPHMIFEGHFHKSMQMFDRNIHAFESGTLCGQTNFMKKIGTPAHMGYWMIDVYMHKQKSKGLERVVSQWIPYFV